MVLRSGRIFSLAVLLALVVLTYYFIRKAKKARPKVRSFSALESLKMAVGRAAELGRPVMWLTGAAGEGLYGRAGNVTLAAMGVLGYLTSLVVPLKAKLIACNAYAEAHPLIEEVMKTEYIRAGKPEMYDANNVRYSPLWYPYVTAVLGHLARERPAAIFFGGVFGHESIVISEPAGVIGSFNVAGTISANQMGYFAATCEDWFFGDEMYAIGAFLSRDPYQMGSLTSGDILKWSLLVLILAGILLSSLGSNIIVQLLAS